MMRPAYQIKRRVLQRCIAMRPDRLGPLGRPDAAAAAAPMIAVCQFAFHQKAMHSEIPGLQ